MTNDELIKRWNNEGGMYEAWGNHIAKYIQEKLREKYPLEVDGYPLQMPVKTRLKTTHSLVDKALYRNKYTECADPYLEIEDKVGLRFITLLEEEVKFISSIIEENNNWNIKQAREIETERLAKPEHFDYQSTHFIIRPVTEMEIDKKIIGKEICCEVQIRTLLQHAWCELSHKVAYKPMAGTTPEIKRALAKSVALIEATGDYFREAASSAFVSSKSYTRIYSVLKQIYEAKCNKKAVLVRSGELIVDALESIIPDTFQKDIQQLLEQKPYIIKNIKHTATTNLLFEQPVVLLIYCLVLMKPTELKVHWPLTSDELQIFYTHLGIAFDD